MGAAEIDAHDLAAELGGRRVGQVLRRIALELLEEDAVARDLADRLPVGGAGDGDRHRAAGAVARQAHHADVVAEVLAAELRADARLLGELEDLLLELGIAEAAPEIVARRRQRVEVAGRGELRDLERELGRGPADDDREVVGRARRGAEGADLGVEERHQALGVEQRLRLLEEVALVRRASALGHEEELVGVAVGREDLDLRGEVRPGVLLPVEVERGELRVAEVRGQVRVEHAARDRRLVAAAGEDVLALLAHDDGGAGVLAHRQDPAGRDVRVLEEVERDEAVVGRGLGVVEDAPELREVPRPEQVGDVAHRLARQQGQRLGLDPEERLAGGLEGGDVVLGDEAVGRLVVAQRQKLLELERWHGAPPSLSARASTVPAGAGPRRPSWRGETPRGAETADRNTRKMRGASRNAVGTR